MRQYGLIAEEVAAVYPELVTRTATGAVQAVRYQELIPMLVSELQRQQQELDELRGLVRLLIGGQGPCPGVSNQGLLIGTAPRLRRRQNQGGAVPVAPAEGTAWGWGVMAWERG